MTGKLLDPRLRHAPLPRAFDQVAHQTRGRSAGRGSPFGTRDERARGEGPSRDLDGDFPFLGKPGRDALLAQDRLFRLEWELEQHPVHLAALALAQVRYPPAPELAL